MTTLAELLLAAPAAALLFAFFGLYRRRPQLVHWPIHLSCVVVTLASWALAARVAGGETLDRTLWSWLSIGGLSVDFGLRIDGLSASVLAMVSLVGALIHFYATGYMEKDPGFGRFFLYFHLFYLSMIGLLVSNNYLQMYLFWEGVGLASYLLIGFWHHKEAARRAALKAFLTNRVGDFGFLVAILLLIAPLGSVRFETVFESLGSLSPARLTAVGFLLAWAAAAKSAQFPLHIWLPDAMEGPTPTSALMHAATMVTAGVFLLARSTPILRAAPDVLTVIAAVGAFTALFAAIVASIKTDLKRILAYSTISHLGLMTLAVGLGSPAAATFHLVVHGFFKALLFLCVGNVLHAVGRPSATIEDVGGLAKRMPWTFAATVVGALSLAGFPPLSGFFSKDQILDLAFHRGGPLLQAASVLIGVASSFYAFRLVLMTFVGPRVRQAPPHHPHEPGPWMLGPVGLLAVGAAAAGWFPGAFLDVLAAGGDWGRLEPLSLPVSAVGTAGALLGLGLAYAACNLRPGWDWEWRAARPRLAAWIEGDFGWQAFVRSAVVEPVAAFARLTAATWDRGIWDKGVDGLARSVPSLAEAGARLSTGLINEYLLWMLAGTAVLAWVTR